MIGQRRVLVYDSLQKSQIPTVDSPARVETAALYGRGSRTDPRRTPPAEEEPASLLSNGGRNLPSVVSGRRTQSISNAETGGPTVSPKIPERSKSGGFPIPAA